MTEDAEQRYPKSTADTMVLEHGTRSRKVGEWNSGEEAKARNRGEKACCSLGVSLPSGSRP